MGHTRQLSTAQTKALTLSQVAVALGVGLGRAQALLGRLHAGLLKLALLENGALGGAGEKGFGEYPPCKQRPKKSAHLGHAGLPADAEFSEGL